MNPKSDITVLKFALATVSLLALVVGGLMAVTAANNGQFDSVLLVLGLALVAQGAYSLAYFGLASSGSVWIGNRGGGALARLGLITGDALALLVGGGLALAALLYNLNSPTGDLEFAPMFIGALMAFQAALGLTYVVVEEQVSVT